MVINIDSNGNIRVGTDSSSTSAKHLAVYLAALTQRISDISYDETSAIKDASYDPETGVLTWLENGAQQSYSMNTPDLDLFIKTSFEYEGVFDPQPVLAAIESAVSSINTDNIQVAYEVLLPNIRSIVQSEIAQKIEDAQTNIEAVEAKVDAVQANLCSSGVIAKLTWLAARCQMQRLDVLASLSLSKRKLDDYVVRAPEIRPDSMPTKDTVDTFVTEN